MSPEKVLMEKGLLLPEPPAAGGNYLAATTVGSLVHLSGVISQDHDGILTGTLGADRTLDEGYTAARQCALLHLAILRRHLGSLDAVRQIVSVQGYVNCVPGFPHPPKAIDGYSDLMVEVFGETGRHTRTAIGVTALPRHALVEVQMVVAL
jgi:enamine deaminase RidA (YjgF/YER057c/UK114 family)